MTTDKQGFTLESGDTTALANPHAIVIASSSDGSRAKAQKATTAKVAASVYTKNSAYTTGSSTISTMVLSAFPDAPIMVSIAQAESHMLPEAQNSHSTAAGLFQILKGTWTAYKCTGDPYNASDNIACARKIYTAQGTVPWLSSSANW